MKRILPYATLLLLAFVLSFVAQEFSWMRDVFGADIKGFYLSLALLLLVGYGLSHTAPTTHIPVYVWAILFGMALQIPLRSLTDNPESLRVIVEILAAFVLFAGGIAVPVKHFRKYFAPIATLALLGTVFAVVLFSYALAGLTGLFGFPIPIISLLVLAAILASVDPTVVMPTLDALHFKRPFLRDIAVSEGAVNDVVGTILTRFFLIAALGAGAVVTVRGGLGYLFTHDALSTFALEIIWGISVGMLGAWILKLWGESVRASHWSDPALFFAIPIFCFALGSLVGGSGFLAAFVAGLLFEGKMETKAIHALFERALDRFMKPVVFVLLGALTPLDLFVELASLGIAVTLVFMFLVRPTVVFASLLPWMLTKRALLSWREVMFLSFIRETGAIPAILLLSAFAEGLVQAEFVFAVGLWVMVLTLVLEPPFIPLLARKLGIAR